MPTYAVFGGTGNTGMPCVAELVKHGYKVRAIVRSRESGEKASAQGAEPVVCQADDANAMKSALTGIAGLFMCIPADSHQGSSMIDNSRRLVDAVVQAAMAAKVPHVVAISAIGAQHSKGTGPIVHCANIERVLKSSGLPHTIVRAPYFFENWRHGIEVAREKGELQCMQQNPDHKFPQCAAADVGRTCARLLAEGPPHDGEDRRRVIELHGPQEYSVNDVAKALSGALGRQVKVSVIPMDRHVSMLRDSGMSDANAKMMAEMYTAWNKGLVEFEGMEQRRGSITLDQGMREIAGLPRGSLASAH